MAENLKQFTPYVAKAGEEYMNDKQLDHFRKILNEWKVELSEDIDRTVHTMQDEVTTFADPNDRASQESDMALELRNRDRERKLIKKIILPLTYCMKHFVEYWAHMFNNPVPLSDLDHFASTFLIFKK